MSIVGWGLEQIVSTSAVYGQNDPVATALPDGGYVVVWDDNRYTGIDVDLDVIRGQRFDAGGNPAGPEFVVSTAATGQQRNPAIATLSNGTFVVTWEDASGIGADTSGTAIRARLFTSEGVALTDEVLVNATVAGDQKDPSIAALADGGFVVTWSDASGAGGDTSGTQIRAQRFTSACAASGSEIEVNTTVANDQLHPVVAGLAGGGFAIAWSDDNDIRTQMFTEGGSKDGPERLVNTSAGDNEGLPSILALDGGGYVVAWSMQRGGQGGFIDLSAKAWFQQYDTNGAALGPNVLAFEWPPDEGGLVPVRPMLSPALSRSVNGGFLLAWDDHNGADIDLQVMGYSALGVRQTDTPALINNTTTGWQKDSALTLLADGRVVAAFENGEQVSSRILDPRDGHVEGTDGGDTLYGNDVYDDTINAAAGNDKLYGLAGNDTLDGGSGDDTLDGGSGADTMYGGEGNDTFMFDTSGDIAVEISPAGGIDVVLSSVSCTLGSNIEDLTLIDLVAVQAFGNDLANILTGNSAANQVKGMAGNDTLDGGAGNDALTGGTGTDLLTGGSECDRFDFNSKSESKMGLLRDVITDFTRGEDRIDLKTIDARTNDPGNDAFRWIGMKAFHHRSGELHYKIVGSDVVVEGDVNGDGRADFQIEDDGLTAIGKVDFIL